MPEILVPVPAELGPDTIDSEFRRLTASSDLGILSVGQPQGWAEQQSDALGGAMRDGDINGDGTRNNPGREDDDPRFEGDPDEGRIINPDDLPDA